MINFIRSILGDKRKLGITAVVVISAAIVLTVFVAQKQQEIRQRAAGEQTAIFFSQGSGCSNPITNASLIRGQTYDISICLNSNGNTISGFDIKIDALGEPDFTGTSITEGTDGLKFNVLGYKDITNRILHFSRVTTDTGMIITGSSLYLGKISLTASNVDTSKFFVSFAQIVSPISESALTVAKPTLTYSILGPTPPTPTATAVSPQGPCYPLGDVNEDGDVNSVDSLRILRYVGGITSEPGQTFNQLNADVDGVGGITSLDYQKILRYVSGVDTTAFPACGAVILTPTPTTTAPIATPTPTGTTFPPADINRDGSIDLIDFNLWLRAAQEIDNPPYSAGGKPYYPDVNNSGEIPNLIDFNMWLAAVPR